MKTCKDCKWYKSCMDICELSPQNCFVFEQRTNFDKVTVSPETLAKFVIFEHISCEPVWCKGKHCEDVDGNCRRCLSAWLKQEAEDDVADNDE